MTLRTETTACAQRYAWTGFAGMVEFYAYYKAVCDRLIAGDAASSRIVDVVTIDTSLGDWGAVTDRVESRLEHEFGNYSAPPPIRD